ncbi:alcohol dehydrogenase catalytic domain-containing protein [Nocardia asteroides]
MRAVVIERFGEPKDVLTTAERPVPEPGPGEVRLELILSPIHNHDLAIVRGVYGYRPELPAVPGSEAVARVDAVGPGVTDMSIGRRVTVSGARNVWAEYFVVPARQAVPLPDTVSDETAAQLLAMPLSALMLIEDLDLRPGEWLAINAANGAVGRLVNVFARQRGLRVLNLVRGSGSVTALRDLGYEPVLDTESEGWRDRVEAATSGGPILRAVDQVGGGAAAERAGVARARRSADLLRCAFGSAVDARSGRFDLQTRGGERVLGCQADRGDRPGAPRTAHQ